MVKSLELFLLPDLSALLSMINEQAIMKSFKTKNDYCDVARKAIQRLLYAGNLN
jgi:hypothetical protein